MCCHSRIAALLLVLGVGTAGCAGTREVRYVYQDGESGVIGMPENTSRWPTYYRKHAEELMAKHFPNGFEVVRAEEVEEGSRTLTINGTKAAELDPGVTGRLIAVGKLGRTASRTQADTTKIKECRIVYKRAEPGAPKVGEYADQASWTPSPYLDPNAQAKHATGANAEVAKQPNAPQPAKSVDEPKSVPTGEFHEPARRRTTPPPPPAAESEVVSGQIPVIAT